MKRVFIFAIYSLLLNLHGTEGYYLFQSNMNATVSFRDRNDGSLKDSVTLDEFREGLDRVKRKKGSEKHILDLMKTYHMFIEVGKNVQGRLYLADIGEQLKIRSQLLTNETLFSCYILPPHDINYINLQQLNEKQSEFTFVGSEDNSCSFIIKNIKNADYFGQWIIRIIYEKFHQTYLKTQFFFINGMRQFYKVKVGSPLTVEVKSPTTGTVVQCSVPSHSIPGLNKLPTNFEYIGAKNNSCSFKIKNVTNDLFGELHVITFASGNYTRRDFINVIKID